MTMADESFNKAGEERKKTDEKKAYANLLDDAISVGNQIKADLNRHRTQNHIRLNSMCMALHSALHILSLFLFVFSDFTDLKMLFHITYSLNIPGCSRPVPLTQMFWKFKYNRHELSGSPNETRTKCCHLFCYHISQHATHVQVQNDSPQVMFDVLAMTELLLYIRNIYDVNFVGKSGEPYIKKELHILFL